MSVTDVPTSEHHPDADDRAGGDGRTKILVVRHSVVGAHLDVHDAGSRIEVVLSDYDGQDPSNVSAERDILTVTLDPRQAHWLKHELLDQIGCPDCASEEPIHDRSARTEKTVDLQSDGQQTLTATLWGPNDLRRVHHGVVWGLQRPGHVVFQVGLTHTAARYLLQRLAGPSDELF